MTGASLAVAMIGQALAQARGLVTELCWNLGDAVIRRRSVLAR